MPRGKKNIEVVKELPKELEVVKEPKASEEPDVSKEPEVPKELKKAMKPKETKMEESEKEPDCGKKRGRKRKDVTKPKRCPTSYILFAKEFQKTMGETLTLGEKSKRCSEAWTKMSDEEKDKYRNMSKEIKEEMHKNAPLVPEKKKRRLSSYILFSMQYRKNFGEDIPFAERSKKCALAWQDMSDVEKQAWKPAEVVV